MPFNQILVGRLNRWVQKLLVIKNTALLDLSGSLQAVIPVFQGVEDRYLQGWARYMVTATAAASAGNLSAIQIRNPPGSGVIAVVENLNILPGATELCQVTVETSSSDRATVISYQQDGIHNPRIDARSNQAPVLIFSKGIGTISAEGGNAFRMLGVTTGNAQPILNEDQQLTVLPGDLCVVFGELVNTQLSVTFQWRERPLESSELT